MQKYIGKTNIFLQLLPAASVVSACVQAAASGHLIIPNEADKNDNGGKDCHNYPDADRKAPARLNRFSISIL